MTSPNLLIIVIDDAGREQFRPYGLSSDAAYLPNIEQFAGKAVQFNAAWSSPACSMSRACAMTGRDARHTGIGALIEDGRQPLLLDEVCFPRALNRATGNAYALGAFGKWHLARSEYLTHPNVVGWSTFSGVMRNLERASEGYYSWNRVTNGRLERIGTYQPAQMVDDALAWINTQKEPWCAWLAFSLVHAPYERPPEGQYDSEAYPLPSAISNGSSGQNILYFKAMLQACDYQIGRLLRGIEKGASANTIKMITADNGTASAVVQPPFDPAHGKTTCYELGVGIPMWIQGTRIGRVGATTDALMHFTDIMPTMIDLAGGDISLASTLTPFDGVSMKPVLDDPSSGSPRTYVYTETFSPNGKNVNAATPGTRAMRNATYKLITFSTGVTFPQLGGAGVGAEFYNLVLDPQETNNLLVNGSPAGLVGTDLSNYTAITGQYASYLAV